MEGGEEEGERQWGPLWLKYSTSLLGCLAGVGPIGRSAAHGGQRRGRFDDSISGQFYLRHRQCYQSRTDLRRLLLVCLLAVSILGRRSSARTREGDYAVEPTVS